MSHSVSSHLRIDVGDYDASIRRFIPGYDGMLEHATAAVAAVTPSLVIDLGAGTGSLSGALLARAAATIELWDVDDSMLAVARDRLRPFGDRARFLHRSFDDSLPPCDAVMASLSLHHIPTMPEKTVLYRRVFDALRPGGIFVNADASVPAQAPRQARVWRVWADHLVANGMDERGAWDRFDEWADQDFYHPPEVELDALRSVGFDASIVWQSGPITVVAGRRAR